MSNDKHLIAQVKPRVGSSNGDDGACISHDNKYVINWGYDFPYGYILVYDNTSLMGFADQMKGQANHEGRPMAAHIGSLGARLERNG